MKLRSLFSIVIITLVAGHYSLSSAVYAAGNFGVGGHTFGDSAEGTLGITNGTEPTTAPADVVQLYSKDKADGDNRLHIKTESGDTISIGNSEIEASSDNLSLQPDSGNVGIGTTSPSAKLEVAGNVIASTPTASNHLATKAYVDATISSSVQDPRTRLLLHMDGTDGSTSFTNSSFFSHNITVNGDANITTEQSKFGGASCYFDGDGDLLVIPDSEDWFFMNGDFTIDFWIYNIGSNDVFQPFIGQYSTSVEKSFFIHTNGGDGRVAAYGFSDEGHLGELQSNIELPQDKWVHIAWVRSGNNYYLFFNGQIVGTATDSRALANATYPLKIGGDYANHYFNGYIDEVRISKGVARWTSNFTPPTGAYGGSSETTASLFSTDKLWSKSNSDIFYNSGKVSIGTENPRGRLDVNGAIYQRGQKLHADYVFEPGYALESIREHATFMWENKHLAAIPKANVDEDGAEIVEVGSHRKGIVEELEKAHIYISQLEKRLEMQSKIFEERLAKIEVMLSTSD
jgi:hypothetical protein